MKIISLEKENYDAIKTTSAESTNILISSEKNENKECKMATENLEEKRQFGRYFTTSNPFDSKIFRKWIELIPDIENQIFLEPFAGSNNLVKMIQDIGLKNEWKCYDIRPPTYNATPEFPVEKRDTLTSFPSEYNVAITNPPYLAKNSATRRKMDYPDTIHDDLYKFCLEKMLEHVDYVAAIIPESYITSELFHNRLYAFISLTYKMFDDTDCPVCLALFIPETKKKECKLKLTDFYVYSNTKSLGKYHEIKKRVISIFDTDEDIRWKFNDPKGSIGIRCVDDTVRPTIKFIHGSEIPETEINSCAFGTIKVSILFFKSISTSFSAQGKTFCLVKLAKTKAFDFPRKSFILSPFFNPENLLSD